MEPEPAESGIDSPYFLFAGRLEELKGLQDVLPHFTASSPAELLIAGSGSYEPRLRELAGRLPRVRFLGNLPSQRMPALIRGALALVMPSLCFEVFPLVVLEAFREGVPVIARRLGPLPELLEEANGGLLFENAAELKRSTASPPTPPNGSASGRPAGGRFFASGASRRSSSATTHWSSASLTRKEPASP